MEKYTLKELRIASKLTQEEVAKRADITKDYVSMMERGIRNPSDKLKEKLAKIFNTTVMQIFLAVQTTKCCVRDRR